jgi:hypothetical protein
MKKRDTASDSGGGECPISGDIADTQDLAAAAADTATAAFVCR